MRRIDRATSLSVAYAAVAVFLQQAAVRDGAVTLSLLKYETLV